MTDAALVAWTSEPVVLAILLLWGLGEAVVLPIVPDVLLGVMALATPAALGLPLVAAVVGAVIGALVLTDLWRDRPALVARLIALQPGLGPHGMTQAQGRIERDGAVRGFAQVGPGLPLKAYVVALLDLRGDPGWRAISRLTLVNRVTRLVPVVAGFALVGILARAAGLSPSAAVPIYVVGWTTFYLAFWWVRRA